MDIFEEFKKIGKVAIEKGKEMGKEAKKHIDIAVLESKINDQKKIIGDIVYNEKIDTGNKDIKVAVDKIDGLKKDIEEIRKEK